MNQIARQETKAQTLESVLINGDLSKLSAEQRVSYYMKVCESVGLNPLTRPFDYLTLNGKVVLYAKRDATDQLRAVHGVSVEEMTESDKEGVYIVTAKVKNAEGRTDIAKGAVNIANLKGDNLANAIMKAETKAKRRATLSICGLGLLDETEVETIPDAKAVEVVPVFKTATLRNQFHKNVKDSMANAQTVESLNEIAGLNKEKFDAMTASGDERDALSVEDLRNFYKMRLAELRKPPKEGSEADIRAMQGYPEEGEESYDRAPLPESDDTLAAQAFYDRVRTLNV